MAQIIRHRKGVLESVSGATKRKAELLIVTGSSGITSTNSSAMVFFGDGTDATPANKIIYGTSTPDLSGASYSTAVDGVPYYNTSSEKLYILAKGGNIEVKATANTGGTGIVSSSAQIVDLTNAGGVGLYSSSQQVAGDLLTDNRNIDLGTGTFDAGTITSDGTLNVSGISNLGVISGSSLDLTGNANIQGNLVLGGNITIGDASSDTISFGGDVASDILPSAANTYDLGSATDTFAEVHATSLFGAINASNNVVSGSTNGGNIAFGITSGVITAELFGGVISGSTQLDGTALGTTSNIEATGSFTGSFVGDGSGLTGLVSSLDLADSNSNTDTVDLLTDTLTFAQSGSVKVVVSNNQVQIGLTDDVTIQNDLTVTGNLTVSGTTTTVNSTVVELDDNVIQLNGSGAANGGLIVVDVTAPNTVSGSLLWDATNDYWKAGALGSETKVLLAGGDDVVSGSAQVTTEAAASEILIKHASNGSIDGASVYSLPSTATIAINDSTPSSAGTTGELIINGTTSGYSGVLTQDLAGTSVYQQYATSADGLVNFSAASGYGIYLQADGNSSKAWVIDTDGDLVAQGNLDVYAQDFRATGDISGSNLYLTGNAVIDGNITLGGNINIGDATGDSIAFNGELTTDIIPDVNNTVDLGSTTRVFAEIHGTNIYGTHNGAVNASNNIVSSSSDTSNVALSISSGVLSAELKGGVVSGSSQLDGSTFGATSLIVASGSFSGSFFGDGSGITGLSTDLAISGSDGSNDTVALLDGALSFAGGTGVSATVATDTVTISVQDGSTSVKGIASFDSDDFSVTSGNVSLKAGDGSTTSGGVRGANLNADVAGTGLSYSLSNQDLNVDYGSTSGTAVQGNTTITVNGTANEIEISGTAAQALGGGASYTIGLPNDVTIGNDLTVTTDASVGGNLTVTGNLSVLGTTTTIDSTTVSIGDNTLELNYGGAQATAGLLVTDATGGTTASGSLLWDGTNDYWKGGALGSEKEFARLNASPTANTVLKANGSGLLVDSVLSDDGTDATFSGDLIVSGLSVGSNGGFLYVDTANTLQSATATTAGDVIQWNGSSFVASNELDGGTF